MAAVTGTLVILAHRFSRKELHWEISSLNADLVLFISIACWTLRSFQVPLARLTLGGFLPRDFSGLGRCANGVIDCVSQVGHCVVTLIYDGSTANKCVRNSSFVLERQINPPLDCQN